MRSSVGIRDLYQLAGAYAPVDRQRERAWARQVASGNPVARERLVLHNLRLVLDIARRYSSAGADREDLVHEGLSGLLRAIDRFDPERGLRFSTYATFWVRQAIGRFVKGPARLVQVPEAILDALARRERELAEVGSADDDEGLGPAELEVLHRWRGPLASLDGLGADQASALDRLVSPSPCPQREVERREVQDRLTWALGTLDERSRLLLARRYDHPGGRPRSYRRLADEFGLSAERLRQVERRALAQLRAALADESQAARAA